MLTTTEDVSDLMRRELEGRGDFGRVTTFPPKRPNGDARQEAPAHGRKPIKVYRGEEYKKAPRRDMVVKGLLGSGELTVWHGAPKSGKSMLVSALALAVAAGWEAWCGRRIKRRGVVLYLVMEGAGGFPSRLEAWSHLHDTPVPDNFVWAPERLSFMTEPTVENAALDVARIRDLVADLEADAGEPVIMIIIDTAARAMTGYDENSSLEMGRFVDQCAILQELPSRPHVIVVHHDNASGTKGRGSTALDGAHNAGVWVKRTEGGRTWQVHQAKDDPETEPEGFKLEVVELGEDEDGDPIKSVVAVEAEAPEPPAPKERRLTPKQQRVLDCFHKAVIEHGEPPPHAHDIPRNSKGARFAWWVEAIIRHTPSGEDAPEWRKRQDAERSARALIDRGIVLSALDYCWQP
jgi:hypothetical protein